MAPRGIRNFNPGNIEDGDFARSLPGYAGGDGRHAIFNSMDDGFNAMERLFNAPNYRAAGQAGGVGGIIARWAPADDGNDVEAYTKYVASKMGIDPSDPKVLADPAMRQRLARTMADYENGPSAMASAYASPEGRPMPPRYAQDDEIEPSLGSKFLSGGPGALFDMPGRPLGESLMLAGAALRDKPQDLAPLVNAFDRPKDLPKRFTSFQGKDGRTYVLDQITGQYKPIDQEGVYPTTPGEKKVDEDFAKTYENWNTAGGQGGVTKQLNELDTASGILEKNKGGWWGGTGPVMGAVSKAAPILEPFVNPEGIKAREAVQSAVQNTMKTVLDSQYSRAEAEQLLSRAFNPSLSDEENLRRIKGIKAQIERQASAKQSMVDYYEKNKTLAGYKGPRPSMLTVDDDAPSASTGGFKVLKVH